MAATDLSGNVRADDYEVAVSGTAASYGYDAAGNLISKTLPGETWTYSWNALNQLTSASRNGALQASFQYDPLGRRVVKSTPAKVTTYTYDGADILRENVTAGGITTTSYYVHGPSIDEPLAKETGGVMTYYHADGLGSIVKETSAAGAVTNTLRYDAWGNIESGARDGFAFTGREWDPETGLYYYKARYYDPRAGRFISEDPIEFTGGVNFYSYVAGDPIGNTDPLGLVKFQGKPAAVATAYRFQAQLRANLSAATKSFFKQVFEADIDAMLDPNYGGDFHFDLEKKGSEFPAGFCKNDSGTSASSPGYINLSYSPFENGGEGFMATLIHELAHYADRLDKWTSDPIHHSERATAAARDGLARSNNPNLLGGEGLFGYYAEYYQFGSIITVK